MPGDDVRVTVSVFNFEAGGWRENGGHDFSGLVAAFTDDPAPDLIVLNEAKYWDDRGETPFLTALAQLASVTGRPYVGRLCAGPLGSAVVYDPDRLRLRRGEDLSFPDKRGRFAFTACGGRARLVVRAEHWAFWSGEPRLERARLLAQFGKDPVPTLIAGDLNSTASGPHLPRIRWDAVPVGIRDYKGIRHADGSWGPDTRAVDRLIGGWDERLARRTVGAGFHHVAELDRHAPCPLPATTNENGSGLHIDHLLINDAWLHPGGGVVPGSYRVHIPAGRPFPSDHRRVTVTLTLTTGAGATACV
jgi:endonuclease/exonuclease/phosphatase family metal-dependent hydrolase